ncbi:disease resistance protein Roq1-like [Lycium barbarum]|uniref:disease resistance protein Roq1-like n=1 Tax=Lycium barbarum TaxID=112863 RepID=UPI00293E0711|nr:disease resistance protein Roq1-like [Lycium barbarum]
MQRLQVLIIGDGTFISDCAITYLPSILRFIEWQGYPSISLPESFEPSQLVVLCLERCRLAELWPISKVTLFAVKTSLIYFFPCCPPNTCWDNLPSLFLPCTIAISIPAAKNSFNAPWFHPPDLPQTDEYLP